MRAPSAAAALKAQPILMLAAMRFLQDNYATLVDGDGLLLPGQRTQGKSPGDITLTVDPLVEARPSRLEGAGTGLFAARDLAEGTIVALYPCDALGVDDQGAGLVDLLASRRDLEYFEAQSQPEYRLYLRHEGCAGWSVDANPTRPVRHGWEAHLVNDAAVCRDDDATPEAIERYLEASVAALNVALVPFGAAPLCACVTCAPVAANTELLTSYGPSFWLGGADATPPLTPRATELVVVQQRASAVAMAAVQRPQNAAAAAALRRGLELALQYVQDLQDSVSDRDVG